MSRPRPSTRIRAFVLTGFCAATLGLAACGGDDEEETTSSTTTEAGATGLGSTDDPEALREQFNAALLETLTTAQDLTDTQAECAIDELQDTITDDVLQELSETGTVSTEVQEAAVDAGLACQDE